MQAKELTFDQLVAEADRLGLELPIEQTPEWASYEETVPGRTFWGCVAIQDDGGETLGVAAFTDYETHGYHYLRSHHGPVWTRELTEYEEREAMVALREFVSARDRKVVFVRLAIEHELDVSHPTLSMKPYDTTVVIDITGSDEDILARMKGRGRRDVRKALRETPATYADETELAAKSFSEYYDVMVETSARDGFAPAPIDDYENTIRCLGPEHCRVFAGRVDGRVITWTMATISGRHAVRYYGASRSGKERALATDGLIFFECCTLGKMGCVDYDQMGIGSEEFPDLMTLNTFKTKFSKEVRHVSPDRDLPVRATFYKSLLAGKKILDKVRG